VGAELPTGFCVPTSGATATERPGVVLAVCCTAVLILSMDLTIVNVALPSIRRDLHAPVSSLQWTAAAYTVMLASLLMLGGSIADRFGRARVFKFGLGLFTLSSLACSLAPRVEWLIAFRAVQGSAASLLNPSSMSIIRNTFDDPRERARAIGIWGAVNGTSLALGPVVGGLLVGLSWRAAFLVNVPIGIAAIALTARFVPESRAARPRAFDGFGQLLVIVMLAGLTSAFIESPDLGWGSFRIIGLLVIAVGASATFVGHELRSATPLIDPRFFRSWPFTGAIVTGTVGWMAFGGFLFVTTLYLQDVRDLSAAAAGERLLPMAGATVVSSLVAGRVVGARGIRLPILVGGLAMSGGSFMLVSLEAGTPFGWLLASYCIFGLGYGAIGPAITAAAVSGMPASRAGVAVAAASTGRQIGLTLGVAVLGAIATSGVGDSLHAHLASASHLAWWILGVLGAVVAGLGLVSSSRAAKASAMRSGVQLGES
jgi:EmrB/QacA subfamily drug resistance transporter